MTAPASFTKHNTTPARDLSSRQRRENRGYSLSEVSNPRALLSGSLSRRIFANMLRRAFPSDSDNACAERGAPVLGISTRHFRRLLQEECAASLPQVFAVMALNGFEIVAKKFEPGDR